MRKLLLFLGLCILTISAYAEKGYLTHGEHGAWVDAYGFYSNDNGKVWHKMSGYKYNYPTKWIYKHFKFKTLKMLKDDSGSYESHIAMFNPGNEKLLYSDNYIVVDSPKLNCGETLGLVKDGKDVFGFLNTKTNLYFGTDGKIKTISHVGCISDVVYLDSKNRYIFSFQNENKLMYIGDKLKVHFVDLPIDSSQKTENIEALAYGSCIYPEYCGGHKDTTIAVGSNGDILYSYDGTEWFKSLLEDDNSISFHDVVFDGAYFVTVGDKGRIYNSLGSNYNWYQFLVAGDDDLKALTSHDGDIVAIPSERGNKNVYHCNGIGCSKISIAELPDNERFLDISYGNGVFVILATGGLHFYSEDGFNWNKAMTV